MPNSLCSYSPTQGGGLKILNPLSMGSLSDKKSDFTVDEIYEHYHRHVIKLDVKSMEP